MLLVQCSWSQSVVFQIIRPTESFDHVQCVSVHSSCSVVALTQVSSVFALVHRSTRFNAHSWFSTTHNDFQIERDLFPVGESP